MRPRTKAQRPHSVGPHDSESEFADEAVSGGPELSGLYSEAPSEMGLPMLGGALAQAYALDDLHLDDDGGNTSDSSDVTDLRVEDDVTHIATALLKLKQSAGRRRAATAAAASASAAAALMWASNNNDPQVLASAAADAAMGLWPDGGFGGFGGLMQGAGFWDAEEHCEEEEDRGHGGRRQSKVRWGQEMMPV